MPVVTRYSVEGVQVALVVHGREPLEVPLQIGDHRVTPKLGPRSETNWPIPPTVAVVETEQDDYVALLGIGDLPLYGRSGTAGVSAEQEPVGGFSPVGRVSPFEAAEYVRGLAATGAEAIDLVLSLKHNLSSIDLLALTPILTVVRITGLTLALHIDSEAVPSRGENDSWR